MESFSPGKGLSFVPDLSIATNWDLSDIYKEEEDQEQRQNPTPTSGALGGMDGIRDLLEGIRSDNREAINIMYDRADELSDIRIREAQVFQKLGLESMDKAYKSKYMYDTLPKYAIAAAVAPNMFLRDVVNAPLANTGGHRAAQIGLTAGAANEPRVQI